MPLNIPVQLHVTYSYAILNYAIMFKYVYCILVFFKPQGLLNERGKNLLNILNLIYRNQFSYHLITKTGIRLVLN